MARLAAAKVPLSIPQLPGYGRTDVLEVFRPDGLLRDLPEVLPVLKAQIDRVALTADHGPEAVFSSPALTAEPYPEAVFP